MNKKFALLIVLVVLLSAGCQPSVISLSNDIVDEFTAINQELVDYSDNLNDTMFSNTSVEGYRIVLDECEKTFDENIIELQEVTKKYEDFKLLIDAKVYNDNITTMYNEIQMQRMIKLVYMLGGESAIWDIKMKGTTDKGEMLSYIEDFSGVIAEIEEETEEIGVKEEDMHYSDYLELISMIQSMKDTYEREYNNIAG
ncbi:MAG: hypothetical protein JXN65_09175 [Clostridia bacterium]|nr:hypothetical protein [Clostridia bacterium]